jgi:3'-phosphoadenosine 5'-phosphosulfate sulfotransferase (PAPS reductase)/FAD synthetase
LIYNMDEAIAYTLEVLQRVPKDTPWLFPQSGGKDSRLTAWLTLALIAEGKLDPPEELVFWMGNTLIEYPTFLQQALEAMDEMTSFAQRLGIKASSFVTHPRPHEDFWVRILGMGLSPPTRNMRWCTDKLKVVPPKLVLQKRGLYGSPTFLGVRYGESQRRDKDLDNRKIQTCSMGAECGPDYLYFRLDKKIPKVLPVLEWANCAIWDFVTLIAPGHGFDPTGLIFHYGPRGDLRYGCWSCGLVWNDRSGEYLAQHNPPLAELVKFTTANFRPGGQAWKTHNRELFDRAGDGTKTKDGRLSLAYCKRLYDWLAEFEDRHGIELLAPWQKAMVLAYWEVRRSAPKSQAAVGGQLDFELEIEAPSTKRLRIREVSSKSASHLMTANLVDDDYHNNIRVSAAMLVERSLGVTWVYGGQVSNSCWWHGVGEHSSLRAYYYWSNQKLVIENASIAPADYL